jgi:hypothetical protein
MELLGWGLATVLRAAAVNALTERIAAGLR